MPNTLYYGDKLQVLREHVPSESVDLIYLDPPFNSDQDYNALCADSTSKVTGTDKGFRDTWRWDAGPARTEQDAVGQAVTGIVPETAKTLLQRTD
jgi:site-specific DNA-methyltransferase (adenine-specific)